MTASLVLAFFAAGINLALYQLIRARWDRHVPALALLALIGAIVGNAIGDAIGFDALRIGDFNLLAASITAQAAMLAGSLLRLLAQERPVG